MRFATLLGSLALTILSAPAVAQSVTYDYDKQADFSSLRTYAWTGGINLRDELNHKRVVTAIESQLGAKGLSRVGIDENPDVLIAYHAAFDRDVQVSASSSEFGNWRWGTNRMGSARVEEIVKGTLVVDLVDPTSGSLIWRGMATKEIDVDAKPDRRDRNMNKAAEKLFKNFPPTE
jgi:hypothetical protein